MGSYTWKAAWGPKYHQSMAISLGALVISSLLSLRPFLFFSCPIHTYLPACAIVIRQILVRENRKLDEDEKAALEGANRLRVEEAARLEGITFEEAMEKRKGFRYLY